jgi:ribosome maturation factor RimP
VGSAETQVEAVREAVEPAVHALGLDLYDVELVGAAGTRTLRVTVAKDGGVDLETITTVTRTVSPLVDAADAVNGSYLLEVSSPGVERTLRTLQHFQGALGEEVSVKFHTEAGPRRVRGALVSADDASIVIDADDGTRAEIAFADVTQARTVFEWGAQLRPGKAKTKTSARAKGGS